MEVEATGYGAGQRDLPIPNLLRVSIGKAVEPRGRGYEKGVVTLIEANIDDMNPEFYNHVMGKLFERGALTFSSPPCR